MLLFLGYAALAPQNDAAEQTIGSSDITSAGAQALRFGQCESQLSMSPESVEPRLSGGFGHLPSQAFQRR